jgi:hypothetical protein
VKLYFTETSGKYFRTQHCIVSLYRSLIMVSKSKGSRIFEGNIRIKKREDALGQCSRVSFGHVGNFDSIEFGYLEGGCEAV